VENSPVSWILVPVNGLPKLPQIGSDVSEDRLDLLVMSETVGSSQCLVLVHEVGEVVNGIVGEVGHVV